MLTFMPILICKEKTIIRLIYLERLAIQEDVDAIWVQKLTRTRTVNLIY